MRIKGAHHLRKLEEHERINHRNNRHCDLDSFRNSSWITCSNSDNAIFLEIMNNMDNQTKTTGKIIKLDERGFGFINSRAMPFTRIFFHWTALSPTTVNFKELKRNMEVEFNLIHSTDRGWRAMKINVLPQEAIVEKIK